MSVLLKILSVLFFPLVALYTFFVYLRNKLYDLGWKKSCVFSVPVISVGNIQLGGTGKTPFVEYLTRLFLLMLNFPPVILTRGYRRKSEEPVIVDNENRHQMTPEIIGDEPFLLSRNLKDITIGIDADRCRMAGRILEKKTKTLLLLDDAFQHRRIARTIDIVLIDVSRWSSLPLLFPLTQFRDVKSSLKRAHIFILTRTNRSPEKTAKVKAYLTSRFNAPILTSETRPQGLWAVDDVTDHLSLKALQNKRIAAFCGLAHPRQFFDMLESCGAKIVYRRAFPDHHLYTESNMIQLQKESQKAGALLIVTTQKDSVKLSGRFQKYTDRMYFLDIAMFVIEEMEFLQFIKDHLE